MDLLINILFFTIVTIFALAYLASFVINLIRAIKVNKLMKTTRKTVKGIISEIVVEKRRVFVKVDFHSLSNNEDFYNVFEFTRSEWKEQYKEGDEVEIIYPDTTSMDKVRCFPIYLEGMKVKIESGPAFTDALMAFAGLFIWVNVLVIYIQKGGFTNTISLCPFNLTSCMAVSEYEMFSLIYVLMILVIYAILAGYLYERFTSLSAVQNQNYLKLCGLKATATVKTFKFGRQKNQKGLKEAQLKIEYYTCKGEKVEADLNSFMYSETQEEFISILYDLSKPKNCVYLKKPVK